MTGALSQHTGEPAVEAAEIDANDGVSLSLLRQFRQRLELAAKFKNALESLQPKDGIAREVPAYAYAHYVGALAAAGLGDKDGFNHRIRAAQITGANEQWVAELRVGLVEDHLADVTADVAAHHEADLRLLAGSSRGVASISSRYVRQPDFRDRITTIVETMSEAEQERFVALVRYLSGAGVTRVLEIGPGRVLTGLVRRIEPELERANLAGIEDLAAAAAFAAAA